MRELNALCVSHLSAKSVSSWSQSLVMSESPELRMRISVHTSQYVAPFRISSRKWNHAQITTIPDCIAEPLLLNPFNACFMYHVDGPRFHSILARPPRLETPARLNVGIRSSKQR